MLALSILLLGALNLAAAAPEAQWGSTSDWSSSSVSPVESSTTSSSCSGSTVTVVSSWSEGGWSSSSASTTYTYASFAWNTTASPDHSKTGWSSAAPVVTSSTVAVSPSSSWVLTTSTSTYAPPTSATSAAPVSTFVGTANRQQAVLGAAGLLGLAAMAI